MDIRELTKSIEQALTVLTETPSRRTDARVGSAILKAYWVGRVLRIDINDQDWYQQLVEQGVPDRGATGQTVRATKD